MQEYYGYASASLKETGERERVAIFSRMEVRDMVMGKMDDAEKAVGWVRRRKALGRWPMRGIWENAEIFLAMPGRMDGLVAEG